MIFLGLDLEPRRDFVKAFLTMPDSYIVVWRHI